MKKILVILACVLVLVSGCGKKNNSDKNVNTDSDFTDTLQDGNVQTDTTSGEKDVDTVTSSEPEIMPANSSFSNLSEEKVAYGCGTQVDKDNRNIGAMASQEQYGKYNALFIGEPQKVIYLTFDEGYENGYTEKILDILKEKGVHATFFVTLDYVGKNKDIIKRMIAEGHTVGNHSCTHPSFAELSENEIKDEIMGLDDYVKTNFGYEMTTFRPPMGEFSEKSLAVTESLGYKTVFWSFAYKDWLTDAQPDADEALARITSSTHDGAVYLLHAVSSTNTSILGAVLDYWKECGYKVCAVV